MTLSIINDHRTIGHRALVDAPSTSREPTITEQVIPCIGNRSSSDDYIPVLSPSPTVHHFDPCCTCKRRAHSSCVLGGRMLAVLTDIISFCLLGGTIGGYVFRGRHSFCVPTPNHLFFFFFKLILQFNLRCFFTLLFNPSKHQ